MCLSAPKAPSAPIQRVAAPVVSQAVEAVERPIELVDKTGLQELLKEKGVATAIYYPLPLHLQKCFSYLGYREGDFPVAEEAAREVLALPIYPELTSDQQNFIASSINSFYKL